MTNFGVERFLQDFIRLAPPPQARESASGPVDPGAPPFSGFVFKLQANMDPQHRDRVAFLRVCSGRFDRNMNARHMRLKRPLKLASPVQFFGQERVVVDQAWPGDIIGLIDTSASLRIGDRCGANAVPYIEVRNPPARLGHEASTSKVSDDQLFYLMSRGLSEEEAHHMIITGWSREVIKELPFEFAMEASQLLKVSLEGAVG